MPKKSAKKSSKKARKKSTSRKKTRQELEQEMLLGLEDESEPNTRQGRWVALGGAILAIVLTLYLTFSPVQSAIYGQLISQELSNDTLFFDSYEIKFSDSVANELSFLYGEEQIIRGVETSVCLQGKKDSEVYVIDELYYPLITYQSYTEVSFKACPDDTLIMLHTHPYKHCEASRTDLSTLRKRKRVTQDLLMIIMCDDDRYVIYS